MFDRFGFIASSGSFKKSSFLQFFSVQVFLSLINAYMTGTLIKKKRVYVPNAFVVYVYITIH